MTSSTKTAHANVTSYLLAAVAAGAVVALLTTVMWFSGQRFDPPAQPDPVPGAPARNIPVP